MTLKDFKELYALGLSSAGLSKLVELYPSTKVCMKLSRPCGESRPVMTAHKASKLASKLEASDFEDGYIRELWIIDGED